MTCLLMSYLMCVFYMDVILSYNYECKNEEKPPGGFLGILPHISTDSLCHL